MRLHRASPSASTTPPRSYTETVTPNILALRADASFGSGHWYEGGGIYRPVHLVRVSPAHIVADGLFVSPQSDGSVVRASAEVELLEAGVGEAAASPLPRAGRSPSDLACSMARSFSRQTTTKATIDAGAPAILLAAELHAPAGSVELAVDSVAKPLYCPRG